MIYEFCRERPVSGSGLVICRMSLSVRGHEDDDGHLIINNCALMRPRRAGEPYWLSLPMDRWIDAYTGEARSMPIVELPRSVYESLQNRAQVLRSGQRELLQAPSAGSQEPGDWKWR